MLYHFQCLDCIIVMSKCSTKLCYCTKNGPILHRQNYKYILATFIIVVMNTLVGCKMYMFTTNENTVLTMII